MDLDNKSGTSEEKIMESEEQAKGAQTPMYYDKFVEEWRAEQHRMQERQVAQSTSIPNIRNYEQLQAFLNQKAPEGCTDFEVKFPRLFGKEDEIPQHSPVHPNKRIKIEPIDEEMFSGSPKPEVPANGQSYNLDTNQQDFKIMLLLKTTLFNLLDPHALYLPTPEEKRRYHFNQAIMQDYVQKSARIEKIFMKFLEKNPSFWHSSSPQSRIQMKQRIHHGILRKELSLLSLHLPANFDRMIVCKCRVRDNQELSKKDSDFLADYAKKLNAIWKFLTEEARTKFIRKYYQAVSGEAMEQDVGV